ncbi:MAG: helix-turn-helix domain-containing protein, partial [Oscillospiraceae bacterium]
MVNVSAIANNNESVRFIIFSPSLVIYFFKRFLFKKPFKYKALGGFFSPVKSCIRYPDNTTIIHFCNPWNLFKGDFAVQRNLHLLYNKLATKERREIMQEIYDFGMRLKELREKRHLSQGEAADRMGVTRSTISAYECNTKTPRLEVIVK